MSAKILDPARAGAVTMPGEMRIAAGQAGATPLAAGPDGPASTEAPHAASVLPHFPNWLVIHHRADDGARVRLGLRREGFEVHWPRQFERVARRDDVARPYLPGYMFARPDRRSASWHRIRGAVPNVIGVVGVREFGRPIHPKPGFVEGLITKAGGAIDGVMPVREDAIAMGGWEEGQELVFTEGTLRDLRAVFKAPRGEDRVVVLLNILGCVREIVVPVEALAKVEA